MTRNFIPGSKKWCDEYFYLPHRKEHRGVGGIFFDYLGRDAGHATASFAPFVESIARALTEAYLPIAERRRHEPWGEAERGFQLIRRGRYVEFNLLHDRGTFFGLKTGGRTESILMSLPPEVRWEYGFVPSPGSREAHLIDVLSTPVDWVG